MELLMHAAFGACIAQAMHDAVRLHRSRNLFPVLASRCVPPRSPQAPCAGAHFAPATPYVLEGCAPTPTPGVLLRPAEPAPVDPAASARIASGARGCRSVHLSGHATASDPAAPSPPTAAFAGHVHHHQHHPVHRWTMPTTAGGLPLVSGVPLPSPVVRPSSDAAHRGQGMARTEAATELSKLEARLARLSSTTQ
jgi:hypothetical protein